MFVEYLVDAAEVAAPIEVDGGIGKDREISWQQQYGMTHNAWEGTGSECVPGASVQANICKDSCLLRKLKHNLIKSLRCIE